MTWGIDVSDNNQPADTPDSIRAGARFVIVKATQGVTDVDSAHDRAVAAARAEKVTVGHYHFAQHVAEAIAEAEFFLTHASVQTGDLTALDLEQMDGDTASRKAYATAWMAYVGAHTGTTPFWYVNGSWFNDFGASFMPGNPLWYANPNNEPGIAVPGRYVLHQYSWTDVDKNYLRPGIDLSDYAKRETDMPLTQADADLIATTLTSNAAFMEQVARFVWTATNTPGQPSYMNQVVEAIGKLLPSDSVSVSTATPQQIAEAVLAALKTALP